MVSFHWNIYILVSPETGSWRLGTVYYNNVVRASRDGLITTGRGSEAGIGKEVIR